MNQDKQDNAGSIASPMKIYLVPLISGLVLHFVFPLRFLPRGWLPLAIGLPVIVIGIILNGWSGTTMGNAGTNPHWNRPAKLLVTLAGDRSDDSARTYYNWYYLRKGEYFSEIFYFYRIK